MIPPPPKYLGLRFLIVGILKALVRDDFRCMITGMYDYRSLEWSTEIMQEVTDSDVSVTLTECLYIFPQSIARISGVDAKDAKVRFADLSSVAINHAYL